MKIMFCFVVAIAFVIGGVGIQKVAPQLKNDGPTTESIEAFQDNASTSLMGEFRSTLSGYLWEKTDEYLHGGVKLRAMTDAEVKNQSAHSASSADELQTHSNETSVIPSEEFDPRGIWGRIERTIKPFFDVRSHHHRNSRETIPLFRFMTWIDPTFVAGYIVGANVINFANPKKPKQVLDFLKEGIKNNPKNIQLRTEYARYLITQSKDLITASEILNTAIQISKSKHLSKVEKESLQDTYRWSVLVFRDLSRVDQMNRIAIEGLTIFPEDPILRKYSNRISN